MSILGYRNYILIITIDNYYFKLGFTIGAYRAKKTLMLDYFFSSLGLSNIRPRI